MRKLIYILIVVTVLLFLGTLFMGVPIIINISEDKKVKTKNATYQLGETINPFKNFDINNGKWTAYLFISENDKNDLSGEMPVGCSFKTTNKKLLKQMQSDLRFIYTGGDMVTVESEIIICNDGRQVFRSGIVLDKLKQGLQNREYGSKEVPKILL